SAARHRVLHSFPTRRSSDLRQELDTVEYCFVSRRQRQAKHPQHWENRDRDGNESQQPPKRMGQGAAERDFGGHTVSLSPVNARRSEEHTSELQSRENLVCRL